MGEEAVCLDEERFGGFFGDLLNFLKTHLKGSFPYYDPSKTTHDYPKKNPSLYKTFKPKSENS